MRLQHLTKENEKLTRFRDQETLMREKLEYYEQIIEEITNTNTELTISLYRTKQATADKADLERQTDELIISNRELK